MRKETFVSIMTSAHVLEEPACRIVYHGAFRMGLGTFALKGKLADIVCVL